LSKTPDKKLTQLLNCLPEEFTEKFHNFDESAVAIPLLEHLIEVIELGSREYFPEWTNHGLPHIFDVVKNSGRIISPKVYSTLTPEDIVCYLLAVLLHDIAMIFSENQLVEVLEKNQSILSQWNLFFTECQHWEKHEVEAKFGTNVCIPTSDDLKRYSNQEKPVVGEFLRRIHGEIAFSIAQSKFEIISGMTDIHAKQKALSEASAMRHICKLAGHIARSHTLDLGKAIQETKADFGYDPHRSAGHKIAEVHYVYLMSLLRISDYLEFRQLSSKRFFNNYFAIKSPISVLENKTMNAFAKPDWESISLGVLTLPYSTTDPTINLNIQNYQVGIQAEIERSWGILVQSYSATASQLGTEGLVIRQVEIQNLMKSDFDVQFFVEPLELTVNKASIIFLLASPLYGYNQSLALREAVSNAHDAIQERKCSGETFEASIELIFDVENERILFRDNGCGMSVNDVKSYFLRIGGRLREDIAWKTERVDFQSKESYAYTSRFGIGVVALFMLGENVCVMSKRTGEHAIETNVVPNTSRFTARKSNSTLTGTAIEVTDLIPGTIDTFISEFTACVKNANRENVLDIAFQYALTCLKFFPTVCRIKISTLNGTRESGESQTELITIPTIFEFLSAKNVSFCTKEVGGFKFDFQLLDNLSSEKFFVIYNGIPVDRSVATTFPNWFIRGSVLVISDPGNRLTFSLKKDEFVKKKGEAGAIDPKDLIHSLLETSLKDYQDTIAEQGDYEKCIGEIVNSRSTSPWKYRPLAYFGRNQVLVPYAFKYKKLLLNINDLDTHYTDKYVVGVVSHSSFVAQLMKLPTSFAVVYFVTDFEKFYTYDAYEAIGTYATVELAHNNKVSQLATVKNNLRAYLDNDIESSVDFLQLLLRQAQRGDSSMDTNLYLFTRAQVRQFMRSYSQQSQ
jgi:hypothetical protein